MLQLTLVALKTILLFQLKLKDLNWVPFLTTPFQSEENIVEARYLMTKAINPYFAEQITQKPLLLNLLSVLHQYPYLYQAYFIIVDALVGYVLTKFASPNQVQMNSQSVCLSENCLDILSHQPNNIFQSSRKKHRRNRHFALLSQCLMSLRSYNFEIAFSCSLLWNKYLPQPKLSNILWSSHNPTVQVQLISQIIHPQINILHIISASYCHIFDPNKLLNLRLGIQQTQSQDFIQRCYIDVYAPTNHSPTLGFIWALFSGMFSRYVLAYNYVFAVFPACFIIPIATIFIKYTKAQMPSEFAGFCIGLYYYSTLLYFQYVNAYNLTLAFFLLFQGSKYIYEIKIAFVLIYTSSFIALMAWGLQLTWTHAVQGNPNFLFFQVFVFYMFTVVLVSESQKQFIKLNRKQPIKVEQNSMDVD